jgi:asparagine synthase (glutamine-hydrolysing)
MCGIVGYIGDGLPHEFLGRLLFSMERRGPDGDGRYVQGSLHMGMRRLSIIDLEHGWQPLKSADGNVIAFQNGEIYNFKALKSELEASGFNFKTESDTEVLAHGYVRWGISGLLNRLDGMFAIALFDRFLNKLHLARDRFGEKPLFYSHGHKVFGYGSTLLAVASMPWCSGDIDITSLERYLALHYVPGDRTIFQNIHQLLPGERLEYDLDSGTFSRERYYVPELTFDKSTSEDELASLIEESVASRLIADVPVGVFLSGGVDSSVIAAIAARKNSRIATFSMGFSDQAFDESKVAAHVAAHIGSEHHSFMFGDVDFPALLKEVAASMDTPVGDQALLPVFWLSREAKNYVTVVLSGEGGDEVFGGYSYYEPFARAENVNQASSIRRWRESVAGLWRKPRFLSEGTLTTPSGFPLMIGEKERAALLCGKRAGADTWEKGFLQWLEAGDSRLLRATAADLGSWLPDDLLVKLDRMTMAHSLEGRAPYLCAKVVEAGLSLDCAQRYDGESKIALRNIAKRYLPMEVVGRRKQGFCLPMKQWLLDWFTAHGGARNYFRSRPVPNVDEQTLLRMVDWDIEHRIIRDRFIFAIVLFAEWWREFSAQRDTILAGAPALDRKFQVNGLDARDESVRPNI